MRCVLGPCIATLHVLIALTVLGCVHVCLRFAVGVGLSGVYMHVSCFDWDVHSCFELSSALSQSSSIRRYIKCYVLLLLFSKKDEGEG